MAGLHQGHYNSDWPQSDYQWRPSDWYVNEQTRDYSNLIRQVLLAAIQVDNEYYQSAINGEYFAELEADYHNSSIVVPLTYNDPGEGKNFVNGTVCLSMSSSSAFLSHFQGAVDIYGYYDVCNGLILV